MSEDTEIDMKEVELNDVDSEKQPITDNGQTAGGEKNGSVTKVPDNKITFTGLSKEELMEVANTPGWVRTRCVLVVLFWLAWVSMLVGAIVIIVQAPHCRLLPEMNWWNEGPLYQVPDLQAFSEGIHGLEAKLEELSQLKVKGLVLGPLHTVHADQPLTLDLQGIYPTQGKKVELVSVLEKAHRKGISVLLDLTPNINRTAPWFSAYDVGGVMERVKAAADYWVRLGGDGIKLSGLTVASSSAEWPELLAAVQGNRTTEDTKRRALMGVAENISATEVSQLLNTSGVDIILSDLLSTNNGGVERIKAMDTLNTQQKGLCWGLGATQLEQLSKQAMTPALIRLYQLLLFTMPGTPVFTYGDEIGLPARQGYEFPKMVWDVQREPAKGEAVNETAEAERKERVNIRKWFISLSKMRVKERSLLHGDYHPLSSSASSLSFLRVWEQNERFITAVNWGGAAETLKFTLAPLEGLELPETAQVRLSTDEELKEDDFVGLDKITLGPGKAVLLQFPFKG